MKLECQSSPHADPSTLRSGAAPGDGRGSKIRVNRKDWSRKPQDSSREMLGPGRAPCPSEPPSCCARRRAARCSAAASEGGDGGWSTVTASAASSSSPQAGSCHENRESIWPGVMATSGASRLMQKVPAAPAREAAVTAASRSEAGNQSLARRVMLFANSGTARLLQPWLRRSSPKAARGAMGSRTASAARAEQASCAPEVGGGGGGGEWRTPPGGWAQEEEARLACGVATPQRMGWAAETARGGEGPGCAP